MPGRHARIRPIHAPMHAVIARSFGDAAGFGDVAPGLGDWVARRGRPFAVERRLVAGSGVTETSRRGFGDSDGFGDAGGFDYGVASMRSLR